MDGSLKMNEALRVLSQKACRESDNWEPVPEGHTFSYQTMGTDAHRELVGNFLRDYYNDIQYWGAGCEIIRRGPYMLTEGGRAKASGMIIPLLELHQEPVVKLIKPLSPEFEEDISFGWQGYVFLSDEGSRIKVEKGSIKFILLHARKVPKKEDMERDIGDGKIVDDGEGARGQ
ncbi:hypothetical protein QBC36DRAFT_249327 [Triangularia setosa]|uniref:Uncharacterized protein n=1 Tax=Triangularia setosa TaxID=2587417 RepID=A0AAN6VY74_9PEZI|nr:hypothetical protein QBC36DRAFT_249327 [Podospora setosa]